MDPAILRLPRELRDLIYTYYFQCDDGYVHHVETNKLTQANGGPIHISLALTCQQIANEVRGLAFRLNPISFTTSFEKTFQEDAALFHAIIYGIALAKEYLLMNLNRRGLFTSEMALAATGAHPQYVPVFDEWRLHGGSLESLQTWNSKTTCGQAPSLNRDLLDLMLELVPKHPDYAKEARVAWSRWGPGIRHPWALKDASPRPWHIPDAAELEVLAVIAEVARKRPFFWPHTKYAYSAASTALRFLDSVSEQFRAEIRSITLVEKHNAVAKPECHGRGFITLCQKNPKLRVKRIVNLWKCVFPVTFESRNTYMCNPEARLDSSSLDGDLLHAKDITKATGAWIMEALALPALGMPEGSYTLVLEGSPTLAHTSRVFRVIQRDTAWQAALDICYRDGLLPQGSWADRRRRVGYFYEGLPDAVRNLQSPHSLVQCNFEIELPYDAQKLVDEHHGWSLQDWTDNWPSHQPQEYQTAHPLPPWHELHWQHVYL